jgi:hypothetical protein
MKKVFVVRGSHDGNIGVYGNVKGAYEKCLEYLHDHVNEINTSYSQALKGCKSWGCRIETDCYDMSCTIEVFYLNA